MKVRLFFSLVILVLSGLFAKAYAAEDLLKDTLGMERIFQIVRDANRQGKDHRAKRDLIAQAMIEHGVTPATSLNVALFFQRNNFPGTQREVNQLDIAEQQNILEICHRAFDEQREASRRHDDEVQQRQEAKAQQRRELADLESRLAAHAASKKAPPPMAAAAAPAGYGHPGYQHYQQPMAAAAPAGYGYPGYQHYQQPMAAAAAPSGYHRTQAEPWGPDMERRIMQQAQLQRLPQQEMPPLAAPAVPAAPLLSVPPRLPIPPPPPLEGPPPAYETVDRRLQPSAAPAAVIPAPAPRPVVAPLESRDSAAGVRSKPPVPARKPRPPAGAPRVEVPAAPPHRHL